MRQLNGKRLLFPAVAAATLCFLSACGDGAADAQSSSDFATQAIHADYSVLVTEGSDATARDYRLEARFRHNSDVLKLDGGDRLEVVNGAERYSLVENALLGRVIYTASRTFDRRNAPLNLTFALQRQIQADADLSLVAIPQPISVLQPQGGDTVALNNNRIRILWQADTDADAMVIEQRYRCSTQSAGLVRDLTAEITTADDGLLDLPVPTVISDETYDAGCRLDLTFTRSRSGSLDNALKSGSTWGRYRVQQMDIRLQF